MFLRLAVLVFLSVSSAVAADDATRWRGADISERMIGNTIVGEANDFFGAAFMIYFHPDGTTKGVAKKFGFTVTDYGHWKIERDLLCVRWSKWEGRNRLCRTTAAKDGEILMYDENDAVTSRQVIRKGNPYNL
ncbi:MAG: hypothetical protein GKS00_25825 [Alphaproteobacteria bacterium]|nr:hypothetical protein [Alphaproteobacteria bacterium]